MWRILQKHLKKKKSFPPKYEMTDFSYKKKEMKKGVNRGEIEIYTPEDQKHKTPEQLMSMVSSYMIDKIIKQLNSY